MEQYQTIILSRDLNPVIKKGMIGVVLEVWSETSFEVEFAREDGTHYEFKGQYTFTIDKSFIKI